MTSAQLKLNLISHSHPNRPLFFTKGQMSCFDTFCISYFKDRDKFSQITEKGLELDKANFAVNGYKVDKEQYLRQTDKDESSSGKAKIKADEVLAVDLSEEDMDNEDMVPLGDRNAILNLDS